MKKIKKGDKVKIICGRDRGREGKIIRVFKKEGKVLVEGVNKVKKHVKSQGKSQPGGIIELEKPIWVARVMLVCPRCKRPTRIGFQIDETGEKIRICRKCQGLIDRGGK